MSDNEHLRALLKMLAFERRHGRAPACRDEAVAWQAQAEAMEPPKPLRAEFEARLVAGALELAPGGRCSGGRIVVEWLSGALRVLEGAALRIHPPMPQLRGEERASGERVLAFRPAWDSPGFTVVVSAAEEEGCRIAVALDSNREGVVVDGGPWRGTLSDTQRERESLTTLGDSIRFATVQPGQYSLRVDRSGREVGSMGVNIAVG